MTRQKVHVVGGGLAGSEIAYFLAQNHIPVVLHEMRPKHSTEAHQTDGFAELVCSNSFKSQRDGTAPALLKEEMRALGSLVLKGADIHAVPSGEALAVDRNLFSEYVSQILRNHPLIEIQNEMVDRPFQDGWTIFATGPLTAAPLAQWIAQATGQDSLYFYDAIAPIVDASGVDRSLCFEANRYGKGEEAAYINCFLNREEYELFIDNLLTAERVIPRPFEQEKFFHSCQPIEKIADSGRESLRFGPMKPVGLTDFRTGMVPYAVVQLRPENLSKTSYNLVGFQTRLKYGEQKRVFSLIPALRNAEFLRFGSIHRNTYLCTPKLLRPDFSLKNHPHVFFAGQITGVEGYLESAAIGLLLGVILYQKMRDLPLQLPPCTSALGALHYFLFHSKPKTFQPNNMNFGIFETCFFQHLEHKNKGDLRYQMISQGRKDFKTWLSQLPFDLNLGGSQMVANTGDHPVALKHESGLNHESRLIM